MNTTRRNDIASEAQLDSGNQRWNYRGAWSDQLERRFLLDAWRHVPDKEVPDCRN